jgi:hypothetical protein
MGVIPIKSERFAKDLANRFAGLTPVLAEHMQDNFGALLPHVFFGDVTRWVVGLVTVSKAKEVLRNRLELTSILKYLEDTYASGDKELQELISVSFLELLPSPGESRAEVRLMVGPALSAQLKVIG